MNRRFYLFLFFLSCFCYGLGQQEANQNDYESFKRLVFNNYESFRNECNQKYAEFLKSAWSWYQSNAKIPIPIERNRVSPRPYVPINEIPVTINPTPVNPVEPKPQPKPISPIGENPHLNESVFPVKFFGVSSEIRLPEIAKAKLNDVSPNSLGLAWEALSKDEMNNAIRDCLETRIRFKLCDWAYLQFILELGAQFCSDENTATFLAAFLYCQSGYQMRLGEDNGRLVMLISSDHYIYNMPYYILDGMPFYPLSETSNQLKICNAKFDNETPLSLIIAEEQLIGSTLSEPRIIKSSKFPEIEVRSQVPIELIKFYNSYPTSAAYNNPLTRWAMYANTPLAQKTKNLLYPPLKNSIKGNTELKAVNKLLNWVQTGFVYEYDDKVWGHDRAFFSEETLYYPYADCEDRAILFSRLVRDLLDLDVALIYYPGHLATAVKFADNVPGDAIIIEGQRFVVCDPTYIGAPVGSQMPYLEYDKAEAIILSK